LAPAESKVHAGRSVERGHKSSRSTLQIATIGEDSDGVFAGLRNASANKLVLICYGRDKEIARRASVKITETAKIDVAIYDDIRPEHPYKDIMQVFSNIVEANREGYDEFLLNVSSGDRMICIAAAVTAFILGFEVFYCKRDKCVMLPPVKLGYGEIVSDVKRRILRALDEAGGQVDSLEKLSELTAYGKPLLSYHIHGSEDARGLVELGLAETTRHSRGQTKVTITALGKMLLIENLQVAPKH